MNTYTFAKAVAVNVRSKLQVTTSCGNLRNTNKKTFMIFLNQIL